MATGSTALSRIRVSPAEMKLSICVACFGDLALRVDLRGLGLGALHGGDEVGIAERADRHADLQRLLLREGGGGRRGEDRGGEQGVLEHSAFSLWMR
jgi:hypothetical protein